LTAAVREAVMDRSEVQPAPEILSGHGPDNARSRRNHVAYLPLAFVGHRHADGMIRGFAAAIPGDIRSDERTPLLRALGRLETIWFGEEKERTWSVERIVGEPSLRSLKPGPYVRPSASWTTVTPMVFDQFPKDRPGRDAKAIIMRSCRHIGLPEPIAVEVSHVSRCLGVPISPEFTLMPKPGIPLRPYAHVSLLFDRPVRGPILLGAGRYQGLGLFRAMDSDPRGPRRETPP
jgi:CRISPR-associated protein Csb2